MRTTTPLVAARLFDLMQQAEERGLTSTAALLEDTIHILARRRAAKQEGSVADHTNISINPSIKIMVLKSTLRDGTATYRVSVRKEHEQLSVAAKSRVDAHRMALGLVEMLNARTVSAAEFIGMPDEGD